MKKILQSLAILTTISFITACGSTFEAASKIGKVIADPSIQVGSFSEQPSTLNLSFLAEPNINLNESNQASAIELQVVYLSDDSKLLSSYYEQYVENEIKDVLGKNYIDHQEYALVPNQYKVISNVKLDEDNRYLGVIIHYSNPEITDWRKVIKLDGKGHKYNILVHVKQKDFEIREYED